MVKSEIRILGFDDGAFESRSKKPVPVIGVIFRGGTILDGALTTKVKVDGTDATMKIVKLINSSRHKQQLKVVMLDGITMAGFNVIDIKELNEKTSLPVVVINRKRPNISKVKKALKKFSDFEKRWRKVENAGKIKECLVNQSKLYFQNVGIDQETAEEVIRISSTRGNIPEPLRVAHLLATAISRGESYGRA